MLISIIIATLIGLIFGKITVKEIKEYVRKHTERAGNTEGGYSDSGACSSGEYDRRQDCQKGREERVHEERKEGEGED
jgi:hypothetical protein